MSKLTYTVDGNPMVFEFDSQGRCAIGSAPWCDIAIFNPGLARTHAMIGKDFNTGEIRIMDFGGGRTMLLNGEELPKGEQIGGLLSMRMPATKVLVHGDEIACGDFRFLFTPDSQPTLIDGGVVNSPRLFMPALASTPTRSGSFIMPAVSFSIFIMAALSGIVFNLLPANLAAWVLLVLVIAFGVIALAVRSRIQSSRGKSFLFEDSGVTENEATGVVRRHRWSDLKSVHFKLRSYYQQGMGQQFEPSIAFKFYTGTVTIQNGNLFFDLAHFGERLAAERKVKVKWPLWGGRSRWWNWDHKTT